MGLNTDTPSIPVQELNLGLAKASSFDEMNRGPFFIIESQELSLCLNPILEVELSLRSDMSICARKLQ